MAEGLSRFHACSPASDLLREEMPPIFSAERRSIGDDVVLLMKESHGSFLPTLNTPGRTCLTSLVEVTAYSWTLSDEWDDLFSSEGFGREFGMAGDGFSETGVAFISAIVALVVG
jgi:hypothetical protein